MLNIKKKLKEKQDKSTSQFNANAFVTKNLLRLVLQSNAFVPVYIDFRNFVNLALFKLKNQGHNQGLFYAT